LRESLKHQKGPTHLLEVGNEQENSIRIFPTNNKKSIPYAALSYCWGGDQESKTTRDNFQERLKGWPLESLPKTIRDAVETARRLGLENLWVDALCIVQDDDEEMKKEMAIMSQIYSGATITIAAARAHNVNEGFLHDRDLHQIYEAVYVVPCRSLEDTKYFRSILLSERPLGILDKNPLDSRAWALQEHLRSFRLLQFGSKQILWKCPEKLHVDGGDTYEELVSTSVRLFTGRVDNKPYLHPIGSFAHKYDLNGLLQNWEDIVSQYSGRSLKYMSDRLPAFAAIAESFAHVMRLPHDAYYAGLWKFDILMQLRWRRPKDTQKDKWCIERTLPSWSWVSLKGKVIFDHPRLPWGGETLQVIWDRSRIVLKVPEFKYGEVEYAQLTVKGYMRHAYWTGKCFVDLTLGGDNVPSTPLPIEQSWDLYEEKQQRVWCLEINPNIAGSSHGLLLTMVNTKIFKRLGYFEFDHSKISPEPINSQMLASKKLASNSNWFYNWKFETIVIQ